MDGSSFFASFKAASSSSKEVFQFSGAIDSFPIKGSEVSMKYDINFERYFSNHFLIHSRLFSRITFGNSLAYSRLTTTGTCEESGTQTLGCVKI